MRSCVSRSVDFTLDDLRSILVPAAYQYLLDELGVKEINSQTCITLKCTASNEFCICSLDYQVNTEV